MPAPVAPPPASAAPATGAAPAAAPAAAPKVPTSSPQLEEPKGDWLEEAGQELVDLDEANEKPRAVTPPRGKKPDGQTPPEEGKGGTPGDGQDGQPGEKGGTQDPNGTPAEPPEDKIPSNIKALREGYTEYKKKLKEIEPEITRLRTRVKELEENPGQGPDKQTAEELKTLRTRNEFLEKEMRFVDYEKSEEYQTKYVKPYAEGWAEAIRDISNLDVEDGQTTRKATQADFLAVANAGFGADRTIANRLFGDAAEDVLYHARNVRKLADAQFSAKERAKTEAEKEISTRGEAAKAAAAERNRLWGQANTELATKYPKFFSEVAGDAEGNEMLKRGFALADYVFNGGRVTEAQAALLPKSFREELAASGRLSPQSTVRLHALIRNKVANHDRLARRLGAAMKELSEARKTLKEYEDGAPPTGGNGGMRRSRSGGSDIDDANAEIDALDKQSRV